MDEEREFLTVSQTAKLIGVTTNSVYTWAEQDKIPHYRIGGIIRLKRSELQEWFKSKRRG